MKKYCRDQKDEEVGVEQREKKKRVLQKKNSYEAKFQIEK